MTELEKIKKLLESGRTGTEYWIELEKENQRIIARLLDNAVKKDRDFN